MMTERERIIAALDLQEMDRPAAASLTLMTTDMYKESKINPAGIFDRPDDLAKLSMLGHDMYGFDTCEIFNIWSHAEFLGVVVDYGDGTGQPYVKSSPYGLNKDFEEPDLDKYLDFPKTKISLAGVKKLRKLAGKDLALNCISSWGPLTTAGHLVGTEQLMFAIATDPEEVKKIIGFVSKFSAGAYKLELENGLMENVDFMCTADPSASGDLISPDMFEEYALPFNKEEQTVFRSNGMRSMLHICGNTTANLPYMIKCGSNAISVEQSVDPYEAVKIADNKVCMFGNVGPIRPLWQGTPEEVIDDTNRSIDAGFRVITPGCSFVPMTPKENIKAMCDTVKRSKKTFSSV
ncbi:MAG: uroporphyrinogen decarboxylase family protein [Candidatus Methanomethylophilaceae archaeon]